MKNSNKKYLAIIPARIGSKRLENKNILPLEGKPLVTYSINAALKSKYIDDTIVSTDAEEIAQISRENGAMVPFLRPEYLATDTAKSIDVVIHSIDFFKSKGIYYENIVLLQPTSPLRSAKDIDNAIELQSLKNANSITSVCEMDHSPLWSNTLPDNYSMEGFLKPDTLRKRSQDLEKFYRLNGAIYIVNTKALLEEKSLISSKKCFAYIMSKNHSVDIDDEVDFKLAEFILNMN